MTGASLYPWSYHPTHPLVSGSWWGGTWFPHKPPASWLDGQLEFIPPTLLHPASGLVGQLDSVPHSPPPDWRDSLNSTCPHPYFLTPDWRGVSLIPSHISCLIIGGASWIHPTHTPPSRLLIWGGGSSWIWCNSALPPSLFGPSAVLFYASTELWWQMGDNPAQRVRLA